VVAAKPRAANAADPSVIIRSRRRIVPRSPFRHLPRKVTR
jgi:hypothetical protein